MQVGDLVQHRFHEYGMGIILESRPQTFALVPGDHYLVRFTKEARPQHYRAKYLEVVSESR